jgi:murein DD-endopeptidase MepM/ murein hydrolase activator NlpD
MGAACSAGSGRFGTPLFTGSTPNQREIISGEQPMPAPIDNAAVSREDLAPPPGAVASQGALSAPMQTQPVIAAGERSQWSATGGSVVTVGPGESLETLSLRYGVPVKEIASANQIHSPADITQGKVIVIPVRVAIAPPPAVPAVAAAAAEEPAAKPAARALKAGSAVHVVESGQTLYSIARKYGARVDDIVAVNGLSSPAAIRVGEKLKIPAGGTPMVEAVAYAPAEKDQPRSLGAPPKPLGTLVVKAAKSGALSVPAEPAAVPEPVVAALPKAPAALPVAVAPALPAAPAAPIVVASAPPAAAAVVDDAADTPSANGTTFRWPVRGRIISSFGAKPNGERNDGINLAVPEGTSVKAAEAGTVIYSGNELAGYGNLVLIRHADGWVSAYAHNGDIIVKRGDQIRRGQVIAHAGMTGSVNAPQVHFELRRGAKPVNPLDYLAGA